jgi:flagellar basal-body rod protein FlgF
MDHLVYVAASGASQVMLAQTANSHNLANASTTGFRGGLISAQSAYLQGEGEDSRVYATAELLGIDFSQGGIKTTGNPMDVAVNGEGWMAIMAADGSEAYSRRGDLRVNEFGQLLDGAGQEILGESGPIALPPFAEMQIGADGTISIVPLGEGPATLAVVDRIKLVNPQQDQLQRNGEGLVQLPDGEVAYADASVSLISGSLESSNVNTVEAMVNMIELSRQFETQIKMMRTAEQLDQASAELMKFGQ